MATVNTRRISGESFLLLRRLSTAATSRRSPENGERMDKGSLYKMLWAGGEIGMKMSDALQLLKRENKHFCNADLFACANTFRDSGRFRHSVEILEWMGKGTIDHSKGDHKSCLDMIYNLKGITEAEKYFGSSSSAAMSLSNPTYGALFHYYSSRLMQLQRKQHQMMRKRMV